MFYTADLKEIKTGKLADVYFVRTMEILKAKKIDKRVKAAFIAKRFREDFGWGVLAGIEEATDLLAKRGKMSGSKSVLRCSRCFQDRMLPFKENRGQSKRGSNRCSCGGRSKELLLPLIHKRKILWDLPTPQVIREYVLKQLPHFDL